jgi:aryl-alcohol dehydrogenase-like predicted oxidoreductase
MATAGVPGPLAFETLVAGSLSVPRIIVGTASMGSVLPGSLGSASERERAFRYLDGVLQIGCRALDTAASYQLGGTERLIGSWMRSRHNRDRVFLITKGANGYPILRPHRVTPGAIAGDLEASLRRLKTDYVDLFLLHRDDRKAPLEPILETLAALQNRGKFRAWGVSNWSHDRVRAIDALAESAGLPSVVASSPHFSLAEWVTEPWKDCVSISGDANREARAFYATTQLPVLAWSPLGNGFFSSRSNGGRTYESPANLGRKQRVELLARKYDVKPVQIALAYLFNQPLRVFAVVATRSLENMQSNLEAATMRISEAEVRWLESGEAPQSS